jgi:putative addiction module component (TIGR02574 family)
MTTQNQALFDAALALPEAERALLVERLLETLSPEPDELTDDEFYTELERRRAEIEQGLVKLIPWSEVRLEE